MASGEQQWNGFNDFCRLYINCPRTCWVLWSPLELLYSQPLSSWGCIFFPSQLAAQRGAAQTDCIQLGIYLILLFHTTSDFGKIMNKLERCHPLCPPGQHTFSCYCKSSGLFPCWGSHWGISIWQPVSSKFKDQNEAMCGSVLRTNAVQ